MTKMNDWTQDNEFALGFESSDANSCAHVQRENLELEVKPENVSLNSFKIKSRLVDKFWGEDGLLDSRIRLKLMDIADDFWEFCDIKWTKPEALILVGSICNYNWSNFSDVDLHLIVDFSEIHDRTDFVQEYFDEKKNAWNTTHDKLKIYGFPVELYVQNTGSEVESGGIYDLKANKWLQEPHKGDLDTSVLDKDGVKKIASKLMTVIDNLCDDFEAEKDLHKIEVIGQKAEKLALKIISLRKKGLQNGEMDSLNIVYKVLRRSGYMERLWNLQDNVYDKVNSISESCSFNTLIKKTF